MRVSSNLVTSGIIQWSCLLVCISVCTSSSLREAWMHWHVSKKKNKAKIMGVTSKIRLGKVCRFYEAAGTLLLALVLSLSLSCSFSSFLGGGQKVENSSQQQSGLRPHELESSSLQWSLEMTTVPANVCISAHFRVTDPEPGQIPDPEMVRRPMLVLRC